MKTKMTIEKKVLRALRGKSKGKTSAELAEAIGADRSSLTSRLSKMYYGALLNRTWTTVRGRSKAVWYA